MIQKTSLRQEIRTLLSSVGESTLTDASSSICHHFCNSLNPSEKKLTMAVYSAHGPEIRLDALHALLPDARLLYPLCHAGGVLSFHEVTHKEELTPGMLGILEPDPVAHTEVAIRDIDIFLCPGIAFGRDHTRLGHGGGFYDRALKQRSLSAEMIGIALNLQIKDSVPHAEHDIHLDRILTEDGYLV